jgi:outer membrane protein assembly factor BamB
MVESNVVFIGISGSVIAFDRNTGVEIWRTHLKSSDFVNVVALDGDIYATTKGALYCLETATGQIRWQNPLKGLGFGLSSIAIPGIQSNSTPIVQKKKREEQAAAAAAAAT